MAPDCFVEYHSLPNAGNGYVFRGRSIIGAYPGDVTLTWDSQDAVIVAPGAQVKSLLRELGTQQA
jgi:hypothetical protein